MPVKQVSMCVGTFSVLPSYTARKHWLCLYDSTYMYTSYTLTGGHHALLYTQSGITAMAEERHPQYIVHRKLYGGSIIVHTSYIIMSSLNDTFRLYEL